jgi:hypothetical protein
LSSGLMIFHWSNRVCGSSNGSMTKWINGSLESVDLHRSMDQSMDLWTNRRIPEQIEPLETWILDQWTTEIDKNRWIAKYRIINGIRNRSKHRWPHESINGIDESHRESMDQIESIQRIDEYEQNK